MAKTRLIVVGGFLGAGKTTLLWETARRLSADGQRVGLITNDQAPGLVDTAFLARSGGEVAEVSGSCFCCNFEGLLDAMARLRDEARADILIAEPVGSCTDLSATIIQPLREQMQDNLAISPLSVLADATRLGEILQGGASGLHPSSAYILRKQIEEADIVVINKADLIGSSALSVLKARLADIYPSAAAISMNARTGEGMQEWLDMVESCTDAGRSIAEVDYDVYAEGEAVLGWLNATLELEGELTEWTGFATDLLTALSRQLDEMDAAVGHVKLMVIAGDGYVMGNVTGKGDTLTIHGTGALTCEATLIINARVEMPPKALENVVREVIASTSGAHIKAIPVAWQCLSPGRPNPTHRYDRVVTSRQ